MITLSVASLITFLLIAAIVGAIVTAVVFVMGR